jgi:hypothetical protein
MRDVALLVLLGLLCLTAGQPTVEPVPTDEVTGRTDGLMLIWSYDF